MTEPDHPSHEEICRACGIVADVASEFDAELCRVHERFCEHLRRAPDAGWINDHVHPSFRGHGIIAMSILEHLGW